MIEQLGQIRLRCPADQRFASFLTQENLSSFARLDSRGRLSPHGHPRPRGNPFHTSDPFLYAIPYDRLCT